MESPRSSSTRAQAVSQRSAISRLAALLGRLSGRSKSDDDDDDNDLPRPNATVPTRLPRFNAATLSFGGAPLSFG
ncbi:MAG: hypothetical protein IPM79_18415 [Polyangiaceae bacterium]|jgi:hypothetical protein|nr:hypothetical protein [Polyangiaceae bacterium]MBK8939533.1 hypothetical protein [Polyangiaceae bacterium]